MIIPTTQQTTDLFLANFEAQLAQTSPLAAKAFLRVLAGTEGVVATALYKFGADALLQSFAHTATGAGLVAIGFEYGVIPKVAVAAVLTADLPGTNGTIIPETVDFVGDSNGVRYRVDAPVTVAGGVAALSLTAKEAGVSGNLNNGETLSIGTQIAGATTIATVTGTTTTGAEAESEEDYRIRVLDAIRSAGGGGNTADYRNWAQEVAGVARAYPYSGKPAALLAESSPPDRTVYVQSTTAIDADGIAPAGLLAQVRDSITTDPVTGFARQPLGLTDETLFVVAITRTPFFVQITGLSVNPTIEATVKAEIETQLTAYFLRIGPFVDGLDAAIDRNDKITDPTVSNVVQDVVGAAGGTIQSVSFDTAPGGSLPEYQLGQGETAKLSAGGITYVG